MSIWLPFASLPLDDNWTTFPILPTSKSVIVRVKFERPVIRGITYLALSLNSSGNELFNVKRIYAFDDYQIIQFDRLLLPVTQLWIAARTPTFINNTLFIDMPIQALDASAPFSATTVETTVNSSDTFTTIVNPRAERKGLTVYNTSTGRLHLKFGVFSVGSTNAQAIAASSVFIPPNGLYECPAYYTGTIMGAFAANNGNARVVEFV